jgi:hypothetical protein
MTPRLAAIAMLCSACLLGSVVHAQTDAPFNRYLATVEAGKQDQRMSEFARTCHDTEIKPNRSFFYTEQNEWLPAQNLNFAFAGYTTGDANTAEVWEYAGSLRVIYLWEVDLEYQRDTLFCVKKSGDITLSVSRFFPTQSGDPREHWIYFHTVKPALHQGSWVSIGIFKDDRGHRLGNPELTSEDSDFIAGERSYHYLNDFDFASLIPTVKNSTSATASAGKESHATP